MRNCVNEIFGCLRKKPKRASRQVRRFALGGCNARESSVILDRRRRTECLRTLSPYLQRPPEP